MKNTRFVVQFSPQRKCSAEKFDITFADCVSFTRFIGFALLTVRTWQVFLCLLAIVMLYAIVWNVLFPLCYVIREFHKFLHRGKAAALSFCALIDDNN